MGCDNAIILYRDVSKNSEFMKILNVADVCDKAGVSYPDEVKKYFRDNDIDWDGKSDTLEEARKIKQLHVGDSEGDWCIAFDAPMRGRTGWTIKVREIPEFIDEIMFFEGC